jgi:hypothetical protein
MAEGNRAGAASNLSIRRLDSDIVTVHYAHMQSLSEHLF